MRRVEGWIRKVGFGARREVKINNESSFKDYYPEAFKSSAELDEEEPNPNEESVSLSSKKTMMTTSQEESSFHEVTRALKKKHSDVEESNIQWLKSESQRTIAELEYGFHGTVDLRSDTPEMELDPDFTCQRFLRGFRQNRSKSLKNLQSYMLWRSVSEKVELEHITESLKAKKVFVLAAPDKCGGPCVLVVARNHNMFKTPIDETVKLLTYSLDKAIEKMDRSRGVTQGCIILDLEGLGWKALDVEALKHIMLFFQEKFPERISVAIFWKAPKVFYGLWAVVKAFLTEETKSKIMFAKHTQDLQKKIELEHIPHCFGGKANNDSLIPIHSL